MRPTANLATVQSFQLASLCSFITIYLLHKHLNKWMCVLKHVIKHIFQEEFMFNMTQSIPTQMHIMYTEATSCIYIHEWLNNKQIYSLKTIPPRVMNQKKCQKPDVEHIICIKTYKVITNSAQTFQSIPGKGSPFLLAVKKIAQLLML